MTRAYTFTFATRLRAPADRVWAHARTFAGVNRELWPLGRMTYPPGGGVLDPGAVPLGRPAFRSWILLLGLVPIDYDDFTLIELAPGRGFSEASRLFSMREWRHRRTVTPAGDGCDLRDEIAFVPRWGFAGPVLARTYRLAFAWRHRALRRLFGTVT